MRLPSWSCSGMLTALTWLAAVMAVAGPSRSGVSSCVTDDDCDTTSGHTCVRLYDGCRVGQCMCSRQRHHDSDDNDFNAAFQHSCDDRRGAGRRCDSSSTRCGLGATCHDDGQCRCAAGRRLTSDRQYCLAADERLLDEPCNVARHVCLHRGVAGYTQNDVRCSRSRGVCQCLPGFKSAGGRCKHWNINEYGCEQSHHCTGGAICRDHQCVCPHDYVDIASATKCARRGAVLNVGRGQPCDEIHERRYCADELICHVCPGDHAHKCVQFLLAEEYAYLLSSTRRDVICNVIIVLMTSSTSVLLLLNQQLMLLIR